MSIKPTEKPVNQGLTAKKIILEEMGLSEERVNSIESVEDADLLIQHFSKKNQAAPEPDLKAKFVKNAKAKAEAEEEVDMFSGILGKPDKVRKNKFIGNLEVQLNPLHPAHENRRNEASRSAMVFVDGEWRLF